MSTFHREYQFEEWRKLSDAQRRHVMHGFWNPYDARIRCGSPTRAAITTAFQEQTHGLPADARINVGYFDKEGWCLTVVTKRSSKVRVPKNFAGLRVVKGVFRNDGSVDWVRM
jgi:hypothetical protein